MTRAKTETLTRKFTDAIGRTAMRVLRKECGLKWRESPDAEDVLDLLTSALLTCAVANTLIDRCPGCAKGAFMRDVEGIFDAIAKGRVEAVERHKEQSGGRNAN